jgi:hypothetical protein
MMFWMSVERRGKYRIGSLEKECHGGEPPPAIRTIWILV